MAKTARQLEKDRRARSDKADRERRKVARERLKSLRGAAKRVKKEKRERLSSIKRSCSAMARDQKDSAKQKRAALNAQLAADRAALHGSCSAARGMTRGAAIERLHEVEAEAQDIRRTANVERVWRGDRRLGVQPGRGGRRAAERRHESDDEVRRNIAPELVPVWNRMKGRFRDEPHRSRTEAFEEWVAENRGDVESMLARSHEDISDVLATEADYYASLSPAADGDVAAGVGELINVHKQGGRTFMVSNRPDIDRESPFVLLQQNLYGSQADLGHFPTQAAANAELSRRFPRAQRVPLWEAHVGASAKPRNFQPELYRHAKGQLALHYRPDLNADQPWAVWDDQTREHRFFEAPAAARAFANKQQREYGGRPGAPLGHDVPPWRYWAKGPMSDLSNSTIKKRWREAKSYARAWGHHYPDAWVVVREVEGEMIRRGIPITTRRGSTVAGVGSTAAPGYYPSSATQRLPPPLPSVIRPPAVRKAFNVLVKQFRDARGMQRQAKANQVMQQLRVHRWLQDLIPTDLLDQALRLSQSHVTV